ncbi:MAG: recombinase family protein [Candidatus Entotheonellia bacterium]
MQQLKTQGQVYSRPVFGEHPDDAATLAHMRTLRPQGYSYHAIADTLNTAGVPTVRGGYWRANTVRQILLRTIHHHQRRVA